MGPLRLIRTYERGPATTTNGNPGPTSRSCITAMRAANADSTGRRNTPIVEVLMGKASWVDGGVDGQGADEVAGEAVAASGRGAVVLA
jgi:hypothetical protein